MTSVTTPDLERRSCRGEPTWEIARFYPIQGEWSEARYLALQTNHLIELSDGVLEFLPMPTIAHQLMLLFLFRDLNAFVRARMLGSVLFAPCPVRTIPGNFREPDIFFVTPDRIRDVHQPAAGADLVVEVVMGDPEDRHRDLVKKRDEYARAHIPEYWIVDPQERTITVLVLEEETYGVHGVFADGTQATSVLLAGFRVSVTEVFAAGEGKDGKQTRP
jgi:Uma2 family endonuclease